MLVSESVSGRTLVVCAFGCAALTLIGSYISHGVSADVDEALRVLVSISANAVTTWLLLRRRAESRRIANSERRYEAVFNSLPVAIWEHDFRPVVAAIAEVRASGVADLRRYVDDHPEFVVRTRRMVRITDANQTALDLMGVASKAQFFSRLSDFLPETDESFANCLIAIDERRPMFQARTHFRSANGKTIDVIAAFGLDRDGALDRVPASILDVTRENQLEAVIASTRAQLGRAERSGALGTISSAIAHELNQPLSAINSYAEAASRWLRRDPPQICEAQQALSHLTEAVQHAHGVIGRVRSLVRDAAFDLGPVDLMVMAASTVEFARHDPATRSVRIHLEPLSTPSNVLGDSVLIKQLLLNLIGNASQAMEAARSPERRVHIRVGLEDGFAILMVRDTGPGWGVSPPEAAFETFFTTRSEGMGLGLSICRSIVELHEGEITLSENPEGGAMVEVRLPLASFTTPTRISVQTQDA